MSDSGELKVEIGDHVPWAKGVIHRFAEKMGFDEASLSEIDLCVTELLTNLVVHKAKNGKVRFHEITENGLSGIEILVEDEGPGIRDIPEVLRGGKSTAGSMGQGLATVQRNVDEFKIHSDSQGTRITIRKYLPPDESKDLPSYSELLVSVSVRTHPESNICGDGHVIRHDGPRTMLAVIDGLGHGKDARNAASRAEAYLHANHRKPLTQMPAELHSILHSTRGGVAGIAVIDKATEELSFVGVGNIHARLWLSEGNGWVRPVSMNGTLGVSFRIPRIFVYPWKRGSIFIMHSDGLRDSWELSKQERSLHPTEIARRLMQRYWRHSDDATVMVVR